MAKSVEGRGASAVRIMCMGQMCSDVEVPTKWMLNLVEGWMIKVEERGAAKLSKNGWLGR
jgi:hypothetical protein